MSIDLYRVDDRLIHGQVVVGWAQPLSAGVIVLVDDAVASSEWEQELYRMGVPAQIEVIFGSVADVCVKLRKLQSDNRRCILLTADVGTMLRLHECSPTFNQVNLGGIHTGPGRKPCLRYLYLSPSEEEHLIALEGRGVTVTAQDLPSCAAMPLQEVLRKLRIS